MRKYKNSLITKLTVALISVTVLSVNLLPRVNIYADEDDNSNQPAMPEIEIIYSTGTQQNAKTKKDETQASANEDDGSFEEIIINDNLSEISGEWEEIHISTAEELITFSKKCRLDVWSQNKRVFLDNDINLSLTDFETIPTFGGYFDGRGHEISGFVYNKPVSNFGLFSYIQENAIVKNLKLSATIRPEGKQLITGGIAGDNSGQIVNCSFDGTVDSYNYVGAIAGYNELTGIISECKSSGTVTGAHYTGGIAGENVGLISSCVNSANVNTVIVEKGMSLEDIDIASVTSGIFSLIGADSNDEKKTQSAIIDSGSIDSGGIAGLSIGVIQFCTNNGEIGYEHVGYNTGGIVGRQSGYVNSCTNNGHVYGRKDVGGIAGQAEPYVVVDFTKDVINKLNEAINKLHDIVSVTIDDAGSESDIVSARLNRIKEFTDKALDNTSYLSDRTVEWTDGVMGSVNQLTGRAEYILRESSKNDGPINDAKNAFSDTEEAAKNLKKTVNDLNIRSYMSEQQREDYDAASERFSELSESLAKNEAKYSEAYYNYALQIINVGTDTQYSHGLEQYGEDGNKLPTQHSGGVFKDYTDIKSWKHSDADCTEFPKNDVYDTDDATQQKAREEAANHRTEITNAAEADTNAEFHILDVRTELVNEASIMAGIVAEVTPAMESATRADADKAAKNLESAAGNLKDAGDKTGSIFKHVADSGSIVFPELGAEYRQKTNQLVEALQGMSDNMGLLNGEMSNGNDILLSDMDDVNDQFNEIMKLYADAIDGVLDADYSEVYDDKSMQVAHTCTDATVASCENRGVVEGDIDISGIAGTMGIEYDFDLESDITGKDVKKFTSTYQSKCVLRDNTNRGIVKAQKSYVGGICGLQEMGTVLLCRNYGIIDGKSSDYVGGITGDSYSYIQKSYAKCSISGDEYVAGIAGHGTNILNCYSMVRISDARSFSGAIAGGVAEDGKVRYNYFVSDELAGIDRVSYVEKAEPVEYGKFTSLPEMPADFKKLKVTFYLDDNDDLTELKSIDLSYGGTLSQDDYPDVEKREGFYASWDILGIDKLYTDEDIKASYIMYKTSLASAQTRSNNQSAILVDGMFREDDMLECMEASTADIKDFNASEHWIVSFNEDDSPSHLVRYRKPDSMKGEPEIYVSHAGKWEKAEITDFGEYNTFTVTDSRLEFAVSEKSGIDIKAYIIIGICILAAAIVIIIIKSISGRRRKSKNTENKDNK